MMRYKVRHLVENAFLHLKQWRGIATRYAKNTALFLAAISLLYFLTHAPPAMAADYIIQAGETITVERHDLASSIGLQATDDGDNFLNLGNIYVSSAWQAVGMGYASLSGIYPDSITLINNGVIEAYALSSETFLTPPLYQPIASGLQGYTNATVINNGSISSTAIALSPAYHSEAYGMSTNTGGTLENNGAITIYSEGSYPYAFGMYGQEDSFLTNTGSIAVETVVTLLPEYPRIYGMQVLANGTIINSGTVYVLTTGAESLYLDSMGDGSAYGLSGSDNATILNNGIVSANVFSAGSMTNRSALYGIYGGAASIIANSGIVSSSGNILGDMQLGEVYGISAGNDSKIINSGIISGTSTIVDGTDGESSGTYGISAGNNSAILNCGLVTVTKGGGATTAVGLYGGNDAVMKNIGGAIIVAADSENNAYGVNLAGGTLANIGLVRVKAEDPSRTWEIYNRSTTESVNLASWSVALRDFDAYKFYGTDGGNMNFTDSVLVLRPGKAEDGFVWNKEYAIADMVNGCGDGTVAAVAQEVPWVTARLAGTDWLDQTVSLTPHFTRKTNPGQLIMSEGVAVTLNQMRALNDVLNWHFRDCDVVRTIIPEPDWSVFITPYTSYIDNSDLDYDARLAGVFAGATYRFNRHFAGGIHLGFSYADVSADSADQDGAKTFLYGLHGIYNFTPDWYLRGQVTGFYGNFSSSDWETGLQKYPLYAEADDIDSYGIYAALNAGYHWRVTDNNTITPEIGLSWLWFDQESYSLKWEDRFGNNFPGYDLYYKDEDYNALYGSLMVRWRGYYGNDSTSLQPTIGVGIRQLLTDGDVESRVKSAGKIFTTNAQEDETVALVEAGLAWKYDIFSLGLAYTGEYGGHQNNHTGWLTLKLEF